MRLLLLVLLAGAIWVAWILWRSARELSPTARKTASRWVLGLAVAAGLALVFFRFGAHWLAIAGAGAALLGRSLPGLLRLVAVAQAWKRFRGNHGSMGGNRAGPGDAGSGSSDNWEAPPHRPRSPTMSREEALSVLNLKEGATEAQILDEYRRLMKRLHPDQGGSAYLTGKLNQAKQTLLG